MNNNKRERCINWEIGEKQLLSSIIRPYLPIIKNKNLSTNSNKEKLKAWREITEKFNAANFRIRQQKQLRNQWKLLKLRYKKKVSTHQQETLKTGGSLKPLSPSLHSVEIPEIIPQEFEVGPNYCNGFQDIPIEHNNVETNIDYITPRSTKDPRDFKPETNKDGFDYKEATFTDMHNFRVLENKRLEKEHEIRIKNMAEIHDQVMINLKLQNEILSKMLESVNKNK